MGIKVLIVDDSATVRAVLSEMLSHYRDIIEIKTAPDAFIARNKVIDFEPDVICLDYQMPKMNGIDFLKRLMRYRPTSVVMVSAWTKDGADITLEALENGAVDYVLKPPYDLTAMEEELITKIRVAAKANPNRTHAMEKVSTDYKGIINNHTPIIAMGASTGGTYAISEILMQMPKNAPAIVIVQHMPSGFTTSFAQRLNTTCLLDVHEAKGGEVLKSGNVYIAPGGFHMVVRKVHNDYILEIGEGEKVSGHKPSVDVLFNSVAKVSDGKAIAVLLTGMGSDGAKGMLNMKNKGCKTIAQDRETSTVFGMPSVAIEYQAVDKVLPLHKITYMALNMAESL